MTLTKAFSYANVTQRRILLLNAFVSAILVSFIAANICLSAQYFSFYMLLSKFMLLALFPGLFMGSLIGRLLFSRIKSTKIVYIIAELLFVSACFLYIFRFFLLPDSNPAFELLKLNEYGLTAACFLIAFLFAVKAVYFLKVTAGDFIDEKQSCTFFLFISMAGIFIGAACSFNAGLLPPDSPIVMSVSAAAAMFVLISSFFISLKYSPSTQYAYRFDEEEEPAPISDKRDDISFTYLNISYIFIYVYLAYISYIKFYGTFNHNEMLFASAAVVFMTAGFAAGRIIHRVFWHIYSEMLFPVFFLLYIFLLYRFGEGISPFTALIFFAPAAFLFGFTLRHTVQAVINRFDHNTAYNILFLSIFIIPAPLLIALSFIEFTYLWYFLIVYVLTALNIIVPGLYLMNKKDKKFQKRLFAGIALISIPAILLMHLYLDIPVNRELYISFCKNFEDIKNTNYNSAYIKTGEDTAINGQPVFFLSDTAIRNMKRAVIPVYLYHPKDEGILILDGNQKFFPNPCLALFKNAEIYDTLPGRFVDFQSLPVAGRPKYVTDTKGLLPSLRGGKKYGTIVDIPNLLDASMDEFRFSMEWIRYVKEHLKPGGIFAEIINLKRCNADFLSNFLADLKSVYGYGLLCFFPNTAVILASDREDAFRLSPEILKAASELVLEREQAGLFYNANHLLSHIISEDVSLMLPIPAIGTANCITNKLKNAYIQKNDLALSLLGEPNQALANAFLRESNALSLLKKASLAEAGKNYVDEMEAIFELKKLAEYNTDLKRYILLLLLNKKEYYYSEALALEKNKDWQTAKKLYEAVLIIDKNNFDANYRLGMLNLTLQNLPSSFQYLHQALNIRKDDSNALTQMGILLFSAGRADEAIVYLNQAMEKREYTAQVFLYMGLACAELGRLGEAKEYLLRAARLDPNDQAIQTSIKETENKIQAELDKWKTDSLKNDLEAERDESFPLPINRSAFEQRIEGDRKAE